MAQDSSQPEFWETRYRSGTTPWDAGGVPARLLAWLEKSRLWPEWGRKIAEVVRTGGRLVGFFYLNDNERGPPFGIDARRLEELRGENFDLIEDEPVPAEQSVPVLAGREVWQAWKRRL